MPVSFDNRWITVFLICCIVSQDSLRGDEPSSYFDQLVQQLDHPRFYQRVSASEELLRSGVQNSGGINPKVMSALRCGLQHDSLELRVAAQRLIHEIEFRYQDEQLEFLLNVRVAAGRIDLPGWLVFSEIIGGDMVARRFFKQLVHRHAGTLRECFGGDNPGLMTTPLRFDPWKLPSENDLDWALLLFLEINRLANHRQPCNWRLITALSNSAMGPDPERRPVVFKRLIESWLGQQSDSDAIRDCLLISMRYGCYSTAIELCERVWANQPSSPATQVTALLVGNALGAVDIQSQATKRIADDRTAVVWQTLGFKPARIRTQVADVARVVLLHQNGIDPRSAGFHDLKADRRLIFRDHSLGFSDQKSREKSWGICDKLIAKDANVVSTAKPFDTPSVLRVEQD